MQQQRTVNRQKSSELNEKEKLLENAKLIYDELKKKYEKFMGQNLSAQDRLKYLDELVEVTKNSLIFHFKHLIIHLCFQRVRRKS